METVNGYRNLYVHTDNKQDFIKTQKPFTRRAKSLLFFLLLRSLNICQMRLEVFYESVVAGTNLYAVVR